MKNALGMNRSDMQDETEDREKGGGREWRKENERERERERERAKGKAKQHGGASEFEPVCFGSRSDPVVGRQTKQECVETFQAKKM